MVDEGFVDTFGDNDLADPELLPVGRKYIGEVMAVVTKDAMPGSYRRFEKPLKDGRVEVPVISVQIRARKFADGQPLVGNLNTFVGTDFWVGDVDDTQPGSIIRHIGVVSAHRHTGSKAPGIEEACQIGRAHV
jgi:hypothetical protein